MTSMDRLYGNRNYGTLEPEYCSDQFSPVTIKGRKQALVLGLQQKLNENQSALSELEKQQKSLQEQGKDLDEQDLKRMKKIQDIISNLKGTIKEQVEMFNLKIDQKTK